MNCKDFDCLLSAYADGELDQKQKEIVQAHLKTCTECQRRLAEYKTFGTRITALRDMPRIPSAKAKIMSHLQGGVEPRKTSRWWRPALAAIPLTLVLVVALILNLPGGHHTITAGELVAALKENTGNISSFRVEGTTKIVTSNGDGTQSINQSSSTIVIDLAAQRSYSDKTTIISTQNVIGITSGSPPSRTESYYVDKYAYNLYYSVNSNSSIKQGVWYKQQMPDILWAAQFHTLNDDRSSLISWLYYDPIVTIVGSEKVNGTDCYKVKIEPGIDEIKAYFPDQQLTITDFNLTGWVDKETLTLVKSELGYRATPYGSPTMQITAINEYSEINQGSVELPPGTVNAIELPALFIPPISTNVKDVVANVRQAEGDQKSYNLTVFDNRTSTAPSVSSSTFITAIIDNGNQNYYLDLRLSTFRTQYYITPEDVFERYDSPYPPSGLESRVWYKLPGLGGNSPSFSGIYQRIVSTIETADSFLGGGGVDGKDCYTINITANYSSFLAVDPAAVSNLFFIVFVDKETYQILAVNLNYRLTSESNVSNVSITFNFSQFNDASVTLPPEVLNAVPAPIPLQPMIPDLP